MKEIRNIFIAQIMIAYLVFTMASPFALAWLESDTKTVFTVLIIVNLFCAVPFSHWVMTKLK